MELGHILTADEAWLLECLIYFQPFFVRIPPMARQAADRLVVLELVQRTASGGLRILDRGIEIHRAVVRRRGRQVGV